MKVSWIRKLLPIFALVALMAVALVACGDDDDDEGGNGSPTPGETPTETPTNEPTEDPTEAPTDEPTEEPTETPTETPVPQPQPQDGAYPPGTRTGDELIDAVIAALESGDSAAIAALINFTEIECVEKVQGAGSPPECPPGVPGGSMVEALPAAQCEGFYVLEDRLDEMLSGFTMDGNRLYAVYAQTDAGTPVFPGGDTVIMLVNDEQGWARMVNIEDGEIVRVEIACGATPAQIISDRGVSEFFLEPAA